MLLASDPCMSEETKAQHYDLFKQGHFPSSANLEYETKLI